MSSAGFEGGEVGSQCAVDLSCEVALEAADGFFVGFAFGDAAVLDAAAYPCRGDQSCWRSLLMSSSLPPRDGSP